MSLFKTLGKKPGKEKVNEYKKKCINYKNGEFLNSYYYKSAEKPKLIDDEYKNDAKNRTGQNANIPIVKINELLNIKDEEIAITWLGHSSSIIQIGKRNILLDPVLSNNVSPVPVGFKRFYKEIPIRAENLPYIDAVIISHNHYDHLDYKTIKLIDKKVGHYYVPLGVECYLECWGVSAEKITAMNWWEEAKLEDITIACTPSNHFSGRNLFDRNASLWASWVIKHIKHKIFFSGDSGYGSHYKIINEKYGDMDVVLMECGQYNKAWSDIHMLPNESFKACMDLKAKNIIPIHWGSFSLSLHRWNEPPEKISRYSKDADIKLVIPKIGETIIINEELKEKEKWW